MTKRIAILSMKTEKKIRILQMELMKLVMYYIKMLKNRFISCLINISKKEIIKGTKEIKNNYRNFIKFEDILECIMYKN